MDEVVDWATTAASTTKERLQRQVATVSNIFAERKSSGDLGFETGFDNISNLNMKSKENVVANVAMRLAACPYSISTRDLERVAKVHAVLVDLLNQRRWKITKIAEEKKNHEEKIIGLRFSMCDCKALVEEA